MFLFIYIFPLRLLFTLGRCGVVHCLAEELCNPDVCSISLKDVMGVCVCVLCLLHTEYQNSTIKVRTFLGSKDTLASPHILT